MRYPYKEWIHNGHVKVPYGTKEIEACAFAFWGGLINSIELPDTITSIGVSAFCGQHKLSSIDIPNSVLRIEDDAFKGCSGLSTIRLPNSVTFLGNSVFEECSNLASVVLPRNLNRIPFALFCGCKSLKEVVIPECIDTICQWAFANCDIRTIQIPKSVEKLEGGAFLYCGNLSEITFKGKICNTGESIFNGCGRVSSISLFVDQPDGFSLIGSFTKDQLSTIKINVPIGTGYSYRSHPFWGQFMCIEANLQ